MAAPLAIVEKDPVAVLTYTISWAAWLATGDTISAVVWTVPTGITQDAVSNDSTTASITLSGGTHGETYDVKCKITTTAGLVDKRTLRFVLSER
jgi:hypothetical protein